MCPPLYFHTEEFHGPKNPVLHLFPTPHPLPELLATIDLFTVSTVLPFQEMFSSAIFKYLTTAQKFMHLCLTSPNRWEISPYIPISIY